MAAAPKPRFFKTPSDFRAWLAANHATATGLWVGYPKTGTGKPSITWPESVDEALCFGWIDGLRKSLDDESYMIRFTPRKPESAWSRVNLGRAKVLQREGRMTPAGLAALERRKAERSGTYAYEQEKPDRLAPDMERRFKANRKAWAWFEARAPSYRRTCLRWVMTAKQEETRERRLATLIASSAKGEVIPPMRWTEKRGKGRGRARPRARASNSTRRAPMSFVSATEARSAASNRPESPARRAP